jgi:excinuclease UvrABC nuclease subunit
MSNTYVVALKKISSTRTNFNDPSLWSKLPPSGGIYLIYKKNVPRPIYCGKAKSLRQRLFHNLLHGQDRSHTLKRKLRKHFSLRGKHAVKTLLQKQYFIRHVVENDPKERSFIEHFMISHYRCPFND